MRKELALVLLFFVLVGLAYGFSTPIFEAPDEVWHYAYLRHLAEQHALPALDHSDESGAYQEVAQPPLYYVVAAAVSGWVRDEDKSELMWHNPGFGYQAGGTVNDNKNMLVHTARERFPGRGVVLALRLARLVSLIFGLLTIVSTWGLGREAFPERPAWALAAAALVAFTPQFLFMSGVASNDSAAAALSTVALWATARAANRGLTTRRSIAIGLLVGLAALTKTSGLLLAPLALGVIALSPASDARHRWGSRAGQLLASAGVALLVAGGWYLRNLLQYGDPLGLQIHVDTPWGREAPASLPTLLAELPRLYRSFWGAFGWGHVEYPLWIYWALALPLLVSLAGWVVTIRKRRLPGRGRTLALAAIWCLLISAALLQWMRQVEAPHGRLLFPAIAAWALLVVGGWSGLWQERPDVRSTAERFLPAAILAAMAALSLLTPWWIIRPAFASPRLMPPAEAAESVEGSPLVYGGRARLLGASLDSETVTPGAQLAVRACWEALVPMERDYTVFVHLLGYENARVAERYTYPGLGRYPTSLWPVGRAFCDVYRLQVEKWAPTPELYDVLVGLYDRSTGERLAAIDSNGGEVSFPVQAQVRVVPDRPLSVSPEHTLAVRLGEEIAVIGYDRSALPHGGGPLTVILYWRAEARPQGDYVAFVHLLDEQGELVAQHDGVPRRGRYPTWAWRAGDLIPDPHVLQIPDLIPGQPLRLVAGMYRAGTLERLPVIGPEGDPTGDLLPLERIVP